MAVHRSENPAPAPCRGFCYFPCRRGGGMINFWGDFTFFLFSLPTRSSGCLRAPRSLWGAFFILGDSLGEWSIRTKKRLCTSVSFLSQSKRPRPYSPPKGGGTASGLCMGLAKSSKGGVRPQHFSKKPGRQEKIRRKVHIFLGAQPLTRSWTYRQARAASPEPASLSWAGNPNAECGRQSTAENLLGGKYIE